MSDNDTATGGEELGTSLTMDEAVAAYAKTLTAKEADPGQSEEIEDDELGDTTDDELAASDEDESEEADGENAEDAGQADDDETEDEPDSDQGRYVAKNGKVKLEDGTTVTVDDLIKGNLRDRDYRQKTMEAAEIRKAAETQSAAAKASQERFEERASFMEALLKSIVPPPPDPNMAQTDPYAYMTQKANHEAWAAHLSQIQAELGEISQSKTKETAETRRETVVREFEALKAAVPEFKDPTRLSRFEADVFKYGAEYGFSREELLEVAMDHRQALVMRDAIRARKIDAQKPKAKAKVEGKPPVIRGGKRLNPAEHQARRASDAMNRLKQTGSTDDAVAAYLASLNR